MTVTTNIVLMLTITFIVKASMYPWMVETEEKTSYMSSEEYTPAPELSDMKINEISDALEEHISEEKLLKDKVNQIKVYLNDLIEKLKNKLESFKINIATESGLFLTSSPQNPTRSRYVHIIPMIQTKNTCTEHLLDKESYLNSINQFSSLLFKKFEDKYKSFDNYLEELSFNSTMLKFQSYIDYEESKLKNINISDWRESWIEKINKEAVENKMKTLENTKEIIQLFKQTLLNQTNFEINVLNEINKQKLTFACCLKKINFEVDGLTCNKPVVNDDSYIVLR